MCVCVHVCVCVCVCVHVCVCVCVCVCVHVCVCEYTEAALNAGFNIQLRRMCVVRLKSIQDSLLPAHKEVITCMSVSIHSHLGKRPIKELT